MEFLYESKKKGQFSCLLTLDINSAFNNIYRTEIIRYLEELGVEYSHLGLIENYLWSRSVILVQVETHFQVGMAQGSCL